MSEKEESRKESITSQIRQSPFANDPLSIEYQRNKKYPGSKFFIEQTLQEGANYKQYIASYSPMVLRFTDCSQYP
jgi:hypothetical protein